MFNPNFSSAIVKEKLPDQKIREHSKEIFLKIFSCHVKDTRPNYEGRGGCRAQFCRLMLELTLNLPTEIDFEAKMDDYFIKTTKLVKCLPTFFRFCQL